MALVGNNNEPLREVANFAYNGSLWVPVTVDVNSYLNVRLPYTEEIEGRSYGYIGGSWQKSGFLLSFSDTYAEAKTNLSAASGNNTLTGTTVPAGEYWKITTAAARNVNKAHTRSIVYAHIDGVTMYLKILIPTGANEFALWNGELLMGPGDVMYTLFEGCDLNDDLHLTYGGYRIDVDQ